MVVNTDILKQFVMHGKATENVNTERGVDTDILSMGVQYKFQILFYGEAKQTIE